MRQLGLVSKIRRKKYNSYRGTTSRIADNVLDRNVEQSAPNKAWVSDVTEFRVAGTKVYLSPIMDLFDRTILAHALSTSPNTTFTSGSLADAIAMFLVQVKDSLCTPTKVSSISTPAGVT
ncbi:transposase [Corynebacterium diphtheriae]|nr:transposase [Corynebacterium diphtheriae]CAB0875592.1 transposase [Corynebacterium diphtheriae]